MSKKEDYSKVTRLEIIDHKNGKGRVYVTQELDNSFEICLQNDGRTLKIFLDKRLK